MHGKAQKTEDYTCANYHATLDYEHYHPYIRTPYSHPHPYMPIRNSFPPITEESYIPIPQRNPPILYSRSHPIMMEHPHHDEILYQDMPYLPQHQTNYMPPLRIGSMESMGRLVPTQELYMSQDYHDQYLDSHMEMMDQDTEMNEKKINYKKRKLEEDDEIMVELSDIPRGFKLPASKSPIMEAMAYCALKKWGIEIQECCDQVDGKTAVVKFFVTDFEKYYKYSCIICSKQNPTEDIGSRVKSLRRWFSNFPKKKDRRENPQFSLEVKADVAKKVYDMIEKYKNLDSRCDKKRRRLTM